MGEPARPVNPLTSRAGPSPVRLPDPATLAEPATLTQVLGPVAEVSAAPLATPWLSGSTHTRLTVRLADGTTRHLVLKRTHVADDWLSRRTGDSIGRESMVLGEPALAAVWSSFASPYLAFAAADGEVALLMEDLSVHLLPDVREPIAEAYEERMLAAAAALHARFWDSPALDLPWLTRPEQLLDLLNARTLEALAPRGFPHPVVERAHSGWKVAFAHLPAR